MPLDRVSQVFFLMFFGHWTEPIRSSYLCRIELNQGCFLTDIANLPGTVCNYYEKTTTKTTNATALATLSAATAAATTYSLHLLTTYYLHLLFTTYILLDN